MVQCELLIGAENGLPYFRIQNCTFHLHFMALKLKIFKSKYYPQSGNLPLAFITFARSVLVRAPRSRGIQFQFRQVGPDRRAY